jgi:3-hydroxyisobutyrate dehydrogenase
VVADSPAEAVRGAERVHLILKADDAVDDVLQQLLSGLGEGVPVVDHSTNLPARVKARAERLAGTVRYLSAPVFMGPRNSREATGMMLVSGDVSLVDELEPALATMTGRVLRLGAEPDQAAKLKISGNGLLVMLTATMGDLFRLADGAGLSYDALFDLLQQFQPTAAGMGQRALAARDNPVGFELTMARKDVGLMIDTAGGREKLVVLPAIADAMDALIEAGHGDEDFTVVGRPLP